MNTVAAVLLAQLITAPAQVVGGAAVTIAPAAAAAPTLVDVASLPPCGPTLVIGTPCVWRVLSRQAFSTSRPGHFLWVAVVVEHPAPFPGADPVTFVRRTALDFSVDFYPQGTGGSCREQHEEYRLSEQYGAPCQ